MPNYGQAIPNISYMVGRPSKDLDLLANYNIITKHAHYHDHQRKEVPPPSTILQASRGAERRRKFPAGGAWGGWRSAGFGEILFEQKHLYPVPCELWEAGELGRVEL